MNQILYENTGSKPANIKNIILFFNIAIIIFGIALVGFGSYGIVQWLQSRVPVSTNKPVINASVVEDTSVKISVTHDKAIEKISYSWNNGEEETILGRNRQAIDYLIDMPFGENVLNISVVDSLGITASFTNTYVYSNGVDIQSPTIELSALEDDKQIHILAMDETEIAYITYRWNEEEETRIDSTDESKTVIETNIDIPKGENELTVVAVDGNNNMETKTQKCVVLTKPVIEIPRQHGEELTITVRDEQGLDYVEYTVNGKKYKWVSSTDNRKEWTHTQKLDPGENEIIINAYNKSGIEAITFRGKCIYTPR